MKFSNIFFTICMLFHSICHCGAPKNMHWDIAKANQLYWDEQYVDAYFYFNAYLVGCGNTGDLYNYTVALIGRNACMLHLDSMEMFHIERRFFTSLLNCEIDEDNEEFIKTVNTDSLYWDAYGHLMRRQMNIDDD